MCCQSSDCCLGIPNAQCSDLGGSGIVDLHVHSVEVEGLRVLLI